ncbi:hypothetical protein ABKV19_016945 [Rosa sericea]
MVLSKPCALVYSSLLLFLLLLFFSEVAFARLSASSKFKEKTELDLLMDFGSDKVTRSFPGQVKLSKKWGLPPPSNPSDINSPPEPRHVGPSTP